MKIKKVANNRKDRSVWDTAASKAVGILKKNNLLKLGEDEATQLEDRIASIGYTYFLFRDVLNDRETFNEFVTMAENDISALSTTIGLLRDQLAANELEDPGKKVMQLKSAISVLEEVEGATQSDLTSIRQWRLHPKTSDDPKLKNLVRALVRQYILATETGIQSLRASGVENPKRRLMAFLNPIIEVVNTFENREITTRQLHDTYVRPFINELKNAETPRAK